MQNRLLLFLPVFIAFFSCSKPAEKSTDPQAAGTTAVSGKDAPVQTCPEFFYYYNREKVSMQLNPEAVLAGFAQTQSSENLRKLLSRFPEFASAGPEQRSAAGSFAVVKLKPGTSCTQTLAFLQKMQQLPEITFANPTFKPPHTLGNTYAWVGITTDFMVTLKQPEDIPVFEEALQETKTKMLEPLGPATFLVQATKTSKGNALEMANYFHNLPFTENAEPDFFLANPQN